MPDTMPSKRPSRNQGQRGDGLLCPSCNGDSFEERCSFKSASEPVLGAVSTEVTVDLMSCNRCGADLPTVRGRRRYTLVSEERLSALIADLEEAQRVNSEMQGLLDKMTKKSQSLGAEIERSIAEGEISVVKARVAALEAETDGLEGRRARLAKTLDLMASRIPAA